MQLRIALCRTAFVSVCTGGLGCAFLHQRVPTYMAMLCAPPWACVNNYTANTLLPAFVGGPQVMDELSGSNYRIQYSIISSIS